MDRQDVAGKDREETHLGRDCCIWLNSWGSKISSLNPVQNVTRLKREFCHQLWSPEEVANVLSAGVLGMIGGMAGRRQTWQRRSEKRDSSMH